MLDFRILGPLEVSDDDHPVRLGGARQRATLAILLLSANRVVPVERLADDLYAGEPPVTAVTQVQRQISELRKALSSPSAIETRAPGYVIRLAPGQLDLFRFERFAREAREALDRDERGAAADLLRRAAELWRGAPLADLADEPFVGPYSQRLEEIRLVALEERIEAELGLGRHAELVGELEQLAREHPLRERFGAQLMLALYRSGRQAEALEAYRRTRTTLVQELGLEPTPRLHDLQKAILAQDRSLELQRGAPRDVVATSPNRAVLVVPADPVEGLLAIAEALARDGNREVVLAHLVPDERELAKAAAALNIQRTSLQARARAAVFTSRDPARDLARLAASQDVELVLVGAPAGLDGAQVPTELAAILEHSPADVAMLAGPDVGLDRADGVFVPFGGGEHDWAALELGAWLAAAADLPLRLVGTKAPPGQGRRDASRLLADASLAVQRVIGIETEPRLAEATETALTAAVEQATVVAVGVSPRWRAEGIGDARRALLRAGRTPLLLVHRGSRPGGLAPRESRTRFTWSIELRPG